MKIKKMEEENVVLVVDDEQSILSAIRRALESDGMTVLTAQSGAEALSILKTTVFEAIVCDYGLPDIDGIDLIIEARKTNPDIGSALITGFGADTMIIEAFTKGGIDCYLSKPFSAKEVINITLLALKESAIRKREREFKSELTRKVEEATKDLTVANRLLEKKEHETALLNKELSQDRERLSNLNERLRKLSITDDMTGLYNHRYFTERLEAELDRVKRYGGELSILIMDIDDFKQVNDRYGHLTGDDVLKEMGNKLLNSSRRIDLPARYGGEEFIVILPSVPTDGAAIHGDRLRKAIQGLSVQTEKGAISVTVSVGVSSYNGTSRYSTHRLVREADKALYHAKSIGKNCVVVYQKSGFTALGKKSSITDAQKGDISLQTLEFARGGHSYSEILLFFSKKIQSALNDGEKPVFVAIYKKEGKDNIAELSSIGGPWKAKISPEGVASSLFKKGRRFESETSPGQYTAFPIKIRKQATPQKNETIAALVINRTLANPATIEEMIDKVAISIENAIALQLLTEEKNKAKDLLEIVEVSRKMEKAITKDNQTNPEKLGATLSEAATLLAETGSVSKSTALVTKDKTLVPASGRGGAKKPFPINSPKKPGLISKALSKAGKRGGVIVTGDKSDLATHDQRLLDQYDVALPFAAIAVAGSKGSSGLLLLGLEYIDKELSKRLSLFGADLSSAIVRASIAKSAKK